METGQKYLQAQKKENEATFFLAYLSVVSPCAIRNETGGKRICCRLRSLNAHAEQEGPKNSAESDTVQVSKNLTTVVTANGEVQTNEEATVYVNEMDLFVTVKLFEDTPSVLSLEKLCENKNIHMSGPVVNYHTSRK